MPPRLKFAPKRKVRCPNRVTEQAPRRAMGLLFDDVADGSLGIQTNHAVMGDHNDVENLLEVGPM